LLKLDPRLVKEIAALGDHFHSRTITERKLRGIIGLSSKEQMATIKNMLT
jgi:hypothetical protein